MKSRDWKKISSLVLQLIRNASLTIHWNCISDDENAIVHGVITEDNLFDGSIHTNSEHYYIEPAHKYSSNLNARGIHSVVYKTSDVHQPPSSALDKQLKGNDEEHFCASERLRKKITEENNLRRKRANRSKRWMPDEVSLEMRHSLCLHTTLAFAFILCRYPIAMSHHCR